MTQNDIDNGRVIAIVQFEAAEPVDTITVVLLVTDCKAGFCGSSEVA